MQRVIKRMLIFSGLIMLGVLGLTGTAAQAATKVPAVYRGAWYAYLGSNHGPKKELRYLVAKLTIQPNRLVQDNYQTPQKNLTHRQWVGRKTDAAVVTPQRSYLRVKLVDPMIYTLQLRVKTIRVAEKRVKALQIRSGGENVYAFRTVRKSHSWEY